MPSAQVPAEAAAVPPVENIGLEDIVALDLLPDRYPNLGNEARWRWWIFHRKANGLESSGALLKRNGRWFVIVPRLRNWLLGEDPVMSAVEGTRKRRLCARRTG